uniref:Beta-galactosidase 10 n=1 Tax=Tanacetum cinerariifolium TaxID=118510 RepID=A0A699HRQ5_TANCI|nr:beta-galactosidase 10 [Tanacetum cinerariifolium]
MAIVDASPADEPVAFDMSHMGKGGKFNSGKCNKGCGEPTQRWYYVLRFWFKPSGNVLVLFEEKGRDPIQITFSRCKLSALCAHVQADKNGHTVIAQNVIGLLTHKVATNRNRIQSPIMSRGKFRSFLEKYGKVAVITHCSISAASITGLYIAINNNVDVQSAIDKINIFTTKEEEVKSHGSNRTAEMVAKSGGAFALAVICNKALFPVRASVTVAITPFIARVLAWRNVV